MGFVMKFFTEIPAESLVLHKKTVSPDKGSLSQSTIHILVEVTRHYFCGMLLLIPFLNCTMYQAS